MKIGALYKITSVVGIGIEAEGKTQIVPYKDIIMLTDYKVFSNGLGTIAFLHKGKLFSRPVWTDCIDSWFEKVK